MIFLYILTKSTLHFKILYSYEVPTTDVKDPDHVIVPIYLREKKSSLSYSPSNLFGQPQLISLPKNNLTYENLYNHLLNRLQRYVTPPPMGQIWWKSNANTNNNNDANHINNNGNESLMNGETTTNTDDDADGLTSSKQQPESTVTSNGENDDGPNDNTNNQVHDLVSLMYFQDWKFKSQIHCQNIQCMLFSLSIIFSN